MGATFLIANRDGGGGNVARAYLGSKKGNDHVLLCESNRVWLSELMGTTSEGIESTTPLARLTSDAPRVGGASRFEVPERTECD